MKPGLAVLPLEVWMDVFDYPWITRQQLAQIVDKFRDRKFAEKLQFFLHDWGKHSLRHLSINLAPRKRGVFLFVDYAFEDCEFPVTEMPRNIKKFKQIVICNLEDKVLDFLGKIKSLFNNVFIRMVFPDNSLRTVLSYLLPMVASIRGIHCDNNSIIAFLEQHFPGTLAQAKELKIIESELAFIPAYLNWLTAPQDYDQHGPRFLAIDRAAYLSDIDIVEAVRKQFLVATKPSTFVIFIDQCSTNESTIENATTNEQLVIRNATYDLPYLPGRPYVQILRHPIGEDANMREWINERAYWRTKSNLMEEQTIWIYGPDIGQITNRREEIGSMDQDGNESTAAGPSTSAYPN